MKGKVKKEELHLILLKRISMGWREMMYVWKLMSLGGRPCLIGTFLLFLREAKIPLAESWENTFEVMLMGRHDFIWEDSEKQAVVCLQGEGGPLSSLGLEWERRSGFQTCHRIRNRCCLYQRGQTQNKESYPGPGCRNTFSISFLRA